MTIQNIVTIDSKDHKLQTPAEPVTSEEFGSIWLSGVVKNLQDTMNASKGTGIAASQIGINKRIIVFGGKSSLNFPEFNIPFTVLINPTYQSADNSKVTLWEHCLSLPGKRGHTIRHARIEYRGYDVTGKEISGKAEGILAVLLQHEIDHTNGKLFPDHVHDPSEYGDITHFEQTKGLHHHIEDGLQWLSDNTMIIKK